MPSDSVAPVTPATIQPHGHTQPQSSSGDPQEPYLQPQHAGFVQPQPAEYAYTPCYAQSSYCGRDWQEVDKQPQLPEMVYLPRSSQSWPDAQAEPLYAGSSGWSAPFTAATPVPINGKNLLHPTHLRNAHQELTAPFHGWGDHQGGYATALYPVRLEAHSPSHCFTDPFSLLHVRTNHQPKTGPARTGKDRKQRHQPYGTDRARGTEGTGAVAGPSTLPPSPVLSVRSPTTQPSGGTSEATTDAENDQLTQEEDEVPVSNCYRSRIPRSAHRSFGVRSPKRLGRTRAHGNTTNCSTRSFIQNSGMGEEARAPQ